MIKKEDLLEAIAECNGVKNPNAKTCMMLSAFYTILDHMEDQDPEVPIDQSYSFAAPPAETVKYNSGTEFSQEVQGKDINEVLEIIDELMTTLQVLHPRLYNGVMIKIAE